MMSEVALEGTATRSTVRAWSPRHSPPMGEQKAVPVALHAFDARAAGRFLDVLADPVGGCVEMRILKATIDRRGFIRRADEMGGTFGGVTLAGWFENHDRLIDQARSVRGVSAYVTINPVRRDLLARSDHVLTRARHTTRDEDILCLRWLYLDIDPVRPPDISSTDSELAAAIDRRDAILDDHPTMASSSFWGTSGNGAWILVRLPDYPNDGEHAKLVARALGALDRAYSDQAVRVDTATANPARIMCLPGTVKAKGSNRPERPWRLVTIDGIGTSLPPIARD